MTRAKAQEPDRTPRPADAPLDQRGLLGLVGYNCRRAYIPIMALFLERLAPLKLRPVDYSVLVLLRVNTGVTQKRLSQALHVSPPNLAVLLDKLEARGLLERVRNPDDRRSQILHLTAAGRRSVDAAQSTVEQLERDATPGLSDAERALLIGLLQRIFMPATPPAKPSGARKARRQG